MIKNKIITLGLLISFLCTSYSWDDKELLKLTLKEDKRIHKISTVSLNNYKPALQPDIFKIKKKYKVDPLKITILSVAGAGAFTALHIYYSNTWWKDQRDYFKFAEDGFYARNMDKASHIYTANLITEGTAMAYQWAGINPKKALLYGAITSMVYETYIEINDGF
ncbi:MAG TPA: DUF2279 domain-containing protein, partial [Ignavibacteria bacterium]|nr:DUF2279 domain-containing protein [Ignavibacteria bacterium]